MTLNSITELSNIFGDQFERAISIIEDQKITIFRTSSNNRRIIEITGSNNAVYKLFPNMNYCPCAGFKYLVLIQKVEYTCKHILAAKIGILLNKVTETVLTDEQINNLMKEIPLQHMGFT